MFARLRLNPFRPVNGLAELVPDTRADTRGEAPRIDPVMCENTAAQLMRDASFFARREAPAPAPLHTIAIGKHMLVQGRLVGWLPDGRLVVDDGQGRFAGRPVARYAAASRH